MHFIDKSNKLIRYTYNIQHVSINYANILSLGLGILCVWLLTFGLGILGSKPILK